MLDIFDLPHGQINDSIMSGTAFLIRSFLPTPSNFFKYVSDPYELTQHPLKARDSSRTLVKGLHIKKDTARFASLGTEVDTHSQEQLS